jgi:hypothetical protein
MSGFVGQLNEFLLRLVKRLATRVTQGIRRERFPGQGGIAAQMYYQGLFEFGPDEALILEASCRMPCITGASSHVDPFYSAIDFIFHAAAYNRTGAARRTARCVS